PSGARALSAGFRGRLALLARSHGIGAPGGRLVRRPGGADDLRSTLVVLLPRSALAASPLGTGPWPCAEYFRWLFGPLAHPTLMIPHAPIAGLTLKQSAESDERRTCRRLDTSRRLASIGRKAARNRAQLETTREVLRIAREPEGKSPARSPIWALAAIAFRKYSDYTTWLTGGGAS